MYRNIHAPAGQRQRHHYSFRCVTTELLGCRALGAPRWGAITFINGTVQQACPAPTDRQTGRPVDIASIRSVSCCCPSTSVVNERRESVGFVLLTLSARGRFAVVRALRRAACPTEENCFFKEFEFLIARRLPEVSPIDHSEDAHMRARA